MKMNFLFCLLLIQCSCGQSSDIELTLHPEDETLVGVWHEIAPKALVVDGMGVVIDSIDVSATYEFNADYTFTAQNDAWTDFTHGTWAFDSTYTFDKVKLYPVDDASPTAYRLDTWDIIANTPPFLEVGHQFDHVFPDHSVGVIYVKRKFEKIE